jgi:hypothetical protein
MPIQAKNLKILHENAIEIKNEYEWGEGGGLKTLEYTLTL